MAFDVNQIAVIVAEVIQKIEPHLPAGSAHTRPANEGQTSDDQTPVGHSIRSGGRCCRHGSDSVSR